MRSPAIFVAFCALFAVVMAAPNPDPPVYRCANDAGDVCPNKRYTCCGPIVSPDGGYCRILKPGEVCIF